MYRGVLISGGWNRGVPQKVSTFQGVGIEGLYCINIKWVPNINTAVFVMVEKSVHRVIPHTQIHAYLLVDISS